jgi:hypothetical protein
MALQASKQSLTVLDEHDVDDGVVESDDRACQNVAKG